MVAGYAPQARELSSNNTEREYIHGAHLQPLALAVWS
jgi:hypothetical protein